MKALMLTLLLCGCAGTLTSVEGGIVPSPGGFDAYCATHNVPECSKP